MTPISEDDWLNRAIGAISLETQDERIVVNYTADRAAERTHTVSATINYSGREPARPRYHANESSRDTIVIEPSNMLVEDVRYSSDPPRLDREGFVLIRHVSRVQDFGDPDAIAKIHRDEIRGLLMAVSGADEVSITSSGILRFSERSSLSGKLDNSKPARFAHIDVSDATAASAAVRANPRPGVLPKRSCAYNVWRVITPPPQDTPLTLCDARSVAPRDLVLADAVFDAADKPEWSFEGVVVAANPAHRWVYWSNMTRDETLIFVTNDSEPDNPHSVPHVAFDDPGCPPDASPRGSIEMRGIAYWY
jgi:hypothetical protein